MRSLTCSSAIVLMLFSTLAACKKKESNPDAGTDEQESCNGETILPRLQVVFSAKQPMPLSPQLVVHLFAQIPNRSDGPDLTLVNKDITLTELPSSFEWEELPELAVGQPLVMGDWNVEVKPGAFAVQRHSVISNCKQLTWTIDLAEAGP